MTTEDFYAWLFERMPMASRKPWGYEMSAWSTPGSTHRERFKKHVLQHVLYDTIKEKPRAVFTAFAEAFPWLAAELAMQRANKMGASALGVQLQRYEAELMLGGVVTALRRELPECRPVTIHDAILCQRQFAAEVRRLMEAEFQGQFGAVARVRTK